MQKIYTTGQVSKIMRVAPRTVSKWFDSGRLEGYRIPGSSDRRIPRSSLVRFMKDYGFPTDALDESDSRAAHRVLLIGLRDGFVEKLMPEIPESNECRFLFAGTGFEAGRIAADFDPGVVVVDTSMGRSEAMMLVGNLRTDPKHAGTLVIGIVGEDECDPEAVIAAGFDCLYRHPFDVAELATEIRNPRKRKAAPKK